MVLYLLLIFFICSVALNISMSLYIIKCGNIIKQHQSFEDVFKSIEKAMKDFRNGKYFSECREREMILTTLEDLKLSMQLRNG